MDIQLIHVTKQFHNKEVFRDLNLTFLQGRVNCLMGASGVGKTTILNIIMGLIKPDSGRVEGVSGRRMAAVFQEDRLIEDWNAVKNIKLVCDKSISEKVIEQELAAVGLENYLGKQVKYFSGGMRRRVAIIRAMLAKSEIIILDEPFKGLDNTLKYQVVNYVLEKSEGKTVIVVTHDKEELQLLKGNLIII